MKPIAIFYEHPDWFRPLFAALERRGVPYVQISAEEHGFDPSEIETRYALVVNRASPSAPTRGHGAAVFYTKHWLHYLERCGVPVVNGSMAYAVETSKVRQITILEEARALHPRTRAVNSPRRILEAARDFRYPILVKANVGGSGAGIARFDSPSQVSDAVAAGKIDLGFDGTALVQELSPLRGGCIQRVEVLGGEVLYGLRVFPDADAYNLCPADACHGPQAAPLQRTACAVDAAKNGMRVEAFDVPADIARQVIDIARRASIDVGGIEYLVDDRDGQALFYDINALSNFVADPLRVVGFDPTERLVDWLVLRAAEKAAN